jgi:light-regulated signal transduction histidine kinase (bacteriophytochrome)
MPLAGSEESVFVTLGIPIEYAFAEVEQSMWRSLILIGFVALLAILAALFFGETFVVRQINQLVETTQNLARGDLSVRTNATYTEGEFGILNQSIDEMAEALAKREMEREQAEAAIREYAESLERSNRDLMDFANITSHDLQEPLRKISTFTDMLLTRHGENLDDQGKDYLLRIRNSARRLQSLIIDLLTFSRISTKTQPTEEVDLGSIMKQVLTDLELQIEQSNATIDICDTPLIHADPVQMHQLFLNLISNSLKFHKSDTSPAIEVSGGLKLKSAGNGNSTLEFYEIQVSDNGIGFDEKYLDRIFQPFQRLHQQDQYEGTGMGLAICRKIVERHGGSITAHSKPGHGATFIVEIPVQKNEGNF